MITHTGMIWFYTEVSFDYTQLDGCFDYTQKGALITHRGCFDFTHRGCFDYTQLDG